MNIFGEMKSLLFTISGVFVGFITYSLYESYNKKYNKKYSNTKFWELYRKAQIEQSYSKPKFDKELEKQLNELLPELATHSVKYKQTPFRKTISTVNMFKDLNQTDIEELISLQLLEFSNKQKLTNNFSRNYYPHSNKLEIIYYIHF